MTARRHTKALEDDPDLEFQYYLAQKLGKTRAELLESLSSAEYVMWSVYYARIAQRQELEMAKSKGGS